ncbi:MAG: hypothetical protein IFNCLDLE_02368 [Ignavibacteriaceae bacterium]|nr:hypothetical protein [Ignavibacteriaceae bacterium]
MILGLNVMYNIPERSPVEENLFLGLVGNIKKAPTMSNSLM